MRIPWPIREYVWRTADRRRVFSACRDAENNPGNEYLAYEYKGNMFTRHFVYGEVVAAVRFYHTMFGVQLEVRRVDENLTMKVWVTFNG